MNRRGVDQDASIESMDALHEAAGLFNAGRFTEFQDSLEALSAATRAPSERQFYTLLGHLAEVMHKTSNEDYAGAEEMFGPTLRKLDEFVPRFRGVNTAALRDECQRLLAELRDLQARRKAELDPARLPRLRFLPE
jgi:uncharacterized protein